MTRLLTIARGLLAVAVLLALLVGIPVALWVFAGNPLTRAAAAATHLAFGDDGTVFIAALTLLGWGSWATFAGSVLAEVAAMISHRPALRLPACGPQQRLAAGLLAAVALSITGPAAIAVTPAVVSSTLATTLSAEVVPGAAAIGTDATPATAETPAAATTTPYTVQPGDTLWDIATRHYGDGMKWRTIADANPGINPHQIDTGQVLQLPTPPAPAPATDNTCTYTVQAGDNLADLTEAHYDDWRLYPALIALNDDVLHGSPYLEPGMQLHLPATLPALATHTVQADDTPRSLASTYLGDPARHREITRLNHLDTHATLTPGDTLRIPVLTPTTPVQENAPTSPAPQADASEPAPTPTPADTADDHAATTETAPAVNAPPAPTTTTAIQTPTVADEDTHQVTDGITDDTGLVTVGGIGALLGAGLLGLLGVRRRRSRAQTDRPGHRRPQPPPAADVIETQIRDVTDPVTADHLTLALRGLTAHWGADDIPTLNAARVTTSGTVELYLTGPSALPAGWTPLTPDNTVWSTNLATETTPLPDEDPRTPWPALVTVGTDDENALLLLDLEQLGALTITGATDPEPVLRALAVELATSALPDDLDITLVATSPELVDALGTGRLTYCADTTGLLTALQERADSTSDILTHHGLDSTHQARSVGRAPDTWAPEIILIGDTLTSSQRHQLAALTTRTPRVGIAAVTTDQPPLGHWVLHLDGDTATLQPAGITLTPQRLTDADYQAVLDLLTSADQPSEPGPWAEDLTTPEPEDILDITDDSDAVQPLDSDRGGDDVLAEAAPLPVWDGPYLRVLGPVELTGTRGPAPTTTSPDGRPTSNHTGKATALITYLATHPAATSDDVADALWPNSASRNTQYTLTRRCRVWLGTDPDGHDHLPKAYNSRLTLVGVGTDWHDFTTLIGDTPTTTDTPRLLAALSLIRGRPFTGITERHYGWADNLRAHITDTILDITTEVTARATHTHNPHQARYAISVALTVDPTHEPSLRNLLLLSYATHDTNGLHQARHTLATLRDTYDDLQPATEHALATTTA